MDYEDFFKTWHQCPKPFEHFKSPMNPPYKYAIKNNFILSQAEQDHCSDYFLIHWSRKYFLSSLKQSNGCWRGQGKKSIYYQWILDQDSNPILLDTNQVQLSFRRASNMETGFVLVRAFIPAIHRV